MFFTKQKKCKAENEMTSKCAEKKWRGPQDIFVYCLILQGVKSIILINTPQSQMWVKFRHSHHSHTFTSPMLQRQNSVKVGVSSVTFENI